MKICEWVLKHPPHHLISSVLSAENPYPKSLFSHTHPSNPHHTHIPTQPTPFKPTPHLHLNPMPTNPCHLPHLIPSHHPQTLLPSHFTPMPTPQTLLPSHSQPQPTLHLHLTPCQPLKPYSHKHFDGLIFLPNTHGNLSSLQFLTIPKPSCSVLFNPTIQTFLKNICPNT